MSNQDDYKDLVGRNIYFTAKPFEPVRGIITEVSTMAFPSIILKCEYGSDSAIIHIDKDKIHKMSEYEIFTNINNDKYFVTFNFSLFILIQKQLLESFQKSVEILENHINKLENE
jgi:hypothetical protein